MEQNGHNGHNGHPSGAVNSSLESLLTGMRDRGWWQAITAALSENANFFNLNLAFILEFFTYLVLQVIYLSLFCMCYLFLFVMFRCSRKATHLRRKNYF